MVRIRRSGHRHDANLDGKTKNHLANGPTVTPSDLSHVVVSQNFAVSRQQ
jgi:hypothetical protein